MLTSQPLKPTYVELEIKLKDHPMGFVDDNVDFAIEF